ncbi:hypothetical protein NIES4071_39210 [Calothrix sp. NIES-4071]|nr:hypothetical protein NIES4071_39210 [Calothrix sp. NIES-4071]BAZ58239.1 hypothetical protein NIES4105_39150 [Calothrix sp. NIES-4105]
MYNQDFEQNIQDFDTAVNLLVNVLKLQDRDLVKVCEEALTHLLGNEETTHMINAAMFQLAETAPETCYWTWHNFPELQVCMDLKEHVSMFVAQKLIQKGFILGKDFSTNIYGEILVSRATRVTLMLDCSPSEWKFIKSVLQIAY